MNEAQPRAFGVRRERSAAFVNRIVNHPSVRPFVDYTGTTSPLDMSSTVVGPLTKTRVLWFSNGCDALATFGLCEDRIWQAHIMFADTCRGRRAIDTAREMLRAMRPHADQIWTAIPDRYPRVRWFARQIGFTEIRPEEYPAEGRVHIFAWKP